MDGLGYAFVVGDTSSSNFPTAYPRQATRAGGRDAFVARIGALPTVQFHSSTYSISETGGTAAITVTLSTAWPVTVTVNYATSDGTATAGSDYTATSGTLSFPPGSLTKTFGVSISDDLLQESDETINLALSSPVSATLGMPYTATPPPQSG